MFYNTSMKLNDNKIYVLMNKPSGYVCALKDNVHPTIISLINEDYVNKLHIVGRLDVDTTGIIVLTNDGQFTHDSTHPKKHVTKTYLVTLEKNIDELLYKREIENGMYIDEGETKLKPGIFKMINEKMCELTISEGKFHQVKKMFAALNNKVLTLHRTSFGEFDIKNYPISEPGSYVKLDI